MRNVILYIAMSLDGYIADKSGGVHWLQGDGSDPENTGSYPKFIDTVDAVILGYTTYHQIRTELSPDKWMYEGKTSYILTHRQEKSTDEIVFTNQQPQELIQGLKTQRGKNIWICGGASVVNQCISLNIIDCYHITVIPTILGAGISLFKIGLPTQMLKLEHTEQYNGMIDLVYTRRA